MIIKMHYVGNPEDEMAGTMSFASLTDAIAVAMEQLSVQNRAFIVEKFFFFFSADSVVKTQQIFRRHFNIARHGKVPCPNALE
jgi:hypothetical protein